MARTLSPDQMNVLEAYFTVQAREVDDLKKLLRELFPAIPTQFTMSRDGIASVAGGMCFMHVCKMYAATGISAPSSPGAEKSTSRYYVMKTNGQIFGFLVFDPRSTLDNVMVIHN